MPKTEQIIREFFEDDIGHTGLTDDALDALENLKIEASPVSSNWFALWDALRCSELDAGQRLLCKAAEAMFALQTYYCYLDENRKTDNV